MDSSPLKDSNSSPSSQPTILWLQVSGLAAMQGAITLAWVIYSLYLPQLLQQLGLPAVLAATILIIEKFLAVVMEPVMGGLSDEAKRWVGTRFPLITGGVILSCTLLIAIPAVVIFGSPTRAFQGILVIIIIAWALAMTVFRSPVISLLGQYATPHKLPLAASLLTLTAGLIVACQPFASQIILGWGAGMTFAIASLILLGAAAILRFVNPPALPVFSVPSSQLAPLPTLSSLLPNLGLIFITGTGITWGTSFFMQTVQKVVKNQFGNIDIKLVMFMIAIALAFAALPAGALAVKLGNQRAMLSGIATTVGLMLLMILFPHPAIASSTVTVLVAAFSLIINGAIPYALSLVPPQRAGLGTGMYFGGVAAAGALFGLIFPQSSLIKLTPLSTGLLAAIAFLLAAICIVASKKVQLVISH